MIDSIVLGATCINLTVPRMTLRAIFCCCEDRQERDVVEEIMNFKAPPVMRVSLTQLILVVFLYSVKRTNRRGVWLMLSHRLSAMRKMRGAGQSSFWMDWVEG